MAIRPEEAARALMARAAREQEQLVERAAELRARLPEIARRLRARFGVRRLILFGSLAWGAFHANSDVDLAVEGLAPEDVGEAMADASAIAGKVVELFRLEALPSSFRERVLSEGEALS